METFFSGLACCHGFSLVYSTPSIWMIVSGAAHGVVRSSTFSLPSSVESQVRSIPCLNVLVEVFYNKKNMGVPLRSLAMLRVPLSLQPPHSLISFVRLRWPPSEPFSALTYLPFAKFRIIFQLPPIKIKFINVRFC